MKILPTLAEVKKLALDARYNVLPVSYEMLSDFTTPIETMKILKNVSTHCYMLESAQANETWGRYTFLGFNPKMEITCMDGEMKIGNLKVKTENPSGYLRQILADYKSPRFDYLPSFTGGLVGYFSYDYLGYSEPSVKCIVEDTENFKDVDLMLFDKVIIRTNNLSAKAGPTNVTTNKGRVCSQSSPSREPRNPIISSGIASSGCCTGWEGTD